MNRISNVTALFGYNKRAKHVLKNYGADAVRSLVLYRIPINDSLTYIANHLDTIEPFDALFSLTLVVQTARTTLLLTKAGTVDLRVGRIQHHRDEESVAITGLKADLSVSEMLYGALKSMGYFSFFTYEPELNGTQAFMERIIATAYAGANATEETTNAFLMQPVQDIFIKHRNFKQIFSTICDLSSVYGRLSSCRITPAALSEENDDK